ncbi:MAG: hypothetical protein QM702_10615 [Rubrivivax sp.]
MLIDVSAGPLEELADIAADLAHLVGDIAGKRLGLQLVEPDEVGIVLVGDLTHVQPVAEPGHAVRQARHVAHEAEQGDDTADHPEHHGDITGY